MSQQAQPFATPLPVGTSIAPGSLRAEMEARRAAGSAFTMKEAIGVVVPLCTQLAGLHAQGRTFFVHPSSLRYTESGAAEVVDERAHVAPTLPRDRACLAPEERKGAEGDARASVFTIGAILYELLTAASVGPGMRRPSDVAPEVTHELEAILGKALVADPKHRPADLGALAQALHHVSPQASIAPPPADESHLDQDEDFEVDVRLSMIPPSEVGPGAIIPRAAPVPQIHSVSGDGPYQVAVRREEPRRNNDPTQRLADMKAALEADPRPRYVVIKDGMDHGPFSAVELLQQIASAQFVEGNVLRDVFSGEERFIKDWDEFAPFAEQAKLNRDIVQEKAALEAVVVAEKRGTQYKALIGAAVIGVIFAAGAGWWVRARSNKAHDQEVQGQEVTSIDFDGGLRSGKTVGAVIMGLGAGGPGAGSGAGSRPPGSYPVVAGAGGCESARAKYVEDYDKSAPPDLSANAYGAVLNNGRYLAACGVPTSMGVTVCAAVQNGRAVGVTVTTNPREPKISSCIAGQVRSLSFPVHPRLDVTTTTF
jgi:eukaryotic-like serine/threonine-protein kinase